MKYVYVYNDDGVGPESLRDTLIFFKDSVRLIDASKVIEGHWREDAGLFVMPGGADIPYHEKLQGAGNKQIKRYVEEGGTYLGICAGAYYACGQVLFSQGFPNEVVALRELKFFAGAAVGPVGTKAEWVPIGESKFWLNQGPYFKDADCYPDVSVIGRYTNGQAAIIEMVIGLGHVILSGVHFEKFAVWLFLFISG